MATIETHAQDCLALIGEKQTIVHEWLDEFYEKYPPKEHGTLHRSFRHTLDGVKELAEKHGGNAGVAAIIHILRDRDGLKPTEQEVIEVVERGLPRMEWERS